MKTKTFVGNVLCFNHNNYYICRKYITISQEGVVCNVSDYKSNNAISFQGVLIPSFCNLHSHLGECMFRHISGTDWTLERYLSYTEKYNKNYYQDELDVKWNDSAIQSINSMKESGTSVFCSARSADVATKNQLNTMAGYPIMNSNKLKRFKEAGINGFISYKEKYLSRKISVGIFLHSLYANNDDSIAFTKECLSAGAEFLTIHISEDCLSRKKEISAFGKPAINTLFDFGLLSSTTILVHCCFTSFSELELIKQSGAIIVVCPMSNIFLNSVIPNINVLNDLDVPWCIGTDGLATGRSFSLIDQANCLLNYYPNISYTELFRRITSIPGKYFNRPIYSGIIEPNTEAKFNLVSYNGTNSRDLFYGIFNRIFDIQYLEL